jgi:two-component system, chemotaxis family, chemotaxis protein CheY
MSKKILLVGHCGPDNSYLRMVLKRAIDGVEIKAADDSAEFSKALQTEQFDLVLFNRELGYGFDPAQGVEAIRVLKVGQPNLRTMLISNYPDAQKEAVAAGALPGFGKREMTSPRVAELLRNAVA